jgi:calcineurin-like phosphoesterase family protein
VTTALISDLHLGQVKRADVLRREDVRAALLAELAGVDRLVLLGDVLELREGPVLAALETARPFFTALGEAMSGREVVLVPGNHDHRLIANWLERRRTVQTPAALGLAEAIAPGEASEAAALLDRWLGRVELSVAYPGLWVRDDVYATHGHYLDRHVTIPGFEPLAIRLSERLLRRGAAEPPPGPEGYEVVLGPVYGLLHEWAQSSHAGTARGAGASQRVYRMLTSDGRGRSLRGRFVGGLAYPAAIAAVNAAGLGPVRADLSGPELRRAGLRAMGETLRRLGVESEHVVFGHTHRAGPLPHDDPAEWRQAGARLVNSGSWVYEPSYLRADAARSPYWPGSVVVVEETGPPELRRLLLEHELTPRPA